MGRIGLGEQVNPSFQKKFLPGSVLRQQNGVLRLTGVLYGGGLTSYRWCVGKGLGLAKERSRVRLTIT